MSSERIDPLNDSRPGIWFAIHEHELLDALIEAHAGISPATVLARLKATSRQDESEQP